MSRVKPDRKPLIALVHNADKAFQAHMVRSAHERGRPDIKPAHNFLFAILGDEGDRAANLAQHAGITRQSMGEVIRDLVDIGILEMAPDPQDGRAKIVRYTPEGKRFASDGFGHLRELEGRFEKQFGADYEAARVVLERVVAVLSEPPPGPGQG
jgi:DNA-binding MarR family transcriptional regulator